MMTKLHFTSVTLCSILLLLSFSSNPPQGRTGGPGEPTCATIGCHSSVTPAFEGHVELKGLPEFILPETTYTLSFDFIVDRGSPSRGGFQMMALDENQVNVGTFSNPSESSTLSTSNNRTYFEHDPARNFDGADTLSYTVDWILPADPSNSEVIFYAAANFANGNGGTSGDRIATLADTNKVGSSTDLNLLLSSTAPTCPGGSDGTITITPQNGTSPFLFSFNDISESNDSSITFTNLQSSKISVLVSDANGLTSEQDIVIGEGVDNMAPKMSCISDTLRISTCNPFSYPIPIATDNCGDVSVNLKFGKGSNNAFEKGIHVEVYEAVDDSGNTSLCSIYIENTVVIDFELVIQNIACINDSLGSVQLNATGSNPPFSLTSLDDQIDLGQLVQGEYNLVVTDATGCQEEMVVSIERLDTLTLNIVEIKQPLNSSSGDGAIDISVAGGTPPYIFNWRTEDEMFSSEEDLSLLFPGDYTVEVTDANGCSIQSDTLRVDAITSAIDIAFSKEITIYPNPSNDILRIDHRELLEVERIEVFNITGQRELLLLDHFSTINVQHLVPGVYILKMIHQEGKIGSAIFQKI